MNSKYRVCFILRPMNQTRENLTVSKHNSGSSVCGLRAMIIFPLLLSKGAKIFKALDNENKNSAIYLIFCC